MNDLYKLLKLRGTTLRQIARETGTSYHPLQKTAKGVRRQPRMQKTIAAYFGVSPKLLFGPKREAAIRLLLEREIDRHAGRQGEKLRRDLRRRYLGAA
jgi:lambda repressor-like predicted transcriptional regulator